MADINDRLGRLNRREELTRRAGQPALPDVPGVPTGGVDEGFAEVLEAVGRVVRRWPGVTVMVAAEGRPGRPVIRLSERDGDVDAVVVGQHVGPPGATAEPGPAHPGPGAVHLGPGYARPGRLERTYPATDRTEAGPYYADRAGSRDADRAGPGYGDAGRAGPGYGGAGPAGPGYGDAGRAGPHHPGYAEAGHADAGHGSPDYAGPGDAGSGPAGAGDADPAEAGYSEPVGGSGSVGAGRVDAAPEVRAAGGRDVPPGVGEEPERDPDRQETYGRPGLRLVPHLPSGRHSSPDEDDRPADGDEPVPAAPGGRLELPEETSEVVARLAQLLREDPSLAATWAREARES